VVITAGAVTTGVVTTGVVTTGVIGVLVVTLEEGVCKALTVGVAPVAVSAPPPHPINTRLINIAAWTLLRVKTEAWRLICILESLVKNQTMSVDSGAFG